MLFTNFKFRNKQLLLCHTFHFIYKHFLFLLFSHRIIEQLENKNSALKEEIVFNKELLNKALLEKDVQEHKAFELCK